MTININNDYLPNKMSKILIISITTFSFLLICIHISHIVDNITLRSIAYAPNNSKTSINAFIYWAGSQLNHPCYYMRLKVVFSRHEDVTKTRNARDHLA